RVKAGDPAGALGMLDDALAAAGADDLELVREVQRRRGELLARAGRTADARLARAAGLAAAIALAEAAEAARERAGRPRPGPRTAARLRERKALDEGSAEHKVCAS